jgi:hypothetical protein
MFHQSPLATALAVAFSMLVSIPSSALAADDSQVALIRAEISQMKAAYEARIQALEAKIEQIAIERVQAPSTAFLSAPPPALPLTPPVQSASTGSAAFNPAISLILGGTYTNLSQDPNQYRIQGFLPSGDIGPGARSFNLGESELTLSANVDPQFSGKLTFSLSPNNSVSVEESFAETSALANGINLRAGRFLSGLGYVNNQHAHAWDFVDAPLVYQAMFGGQYKTDGLQVRWLAPTEQFVELGAEVGQGLAFPGNDRNKNGIGSSLLFAHIGDDIGDSSSWRVGLSYLHSGAADRAYQDLDHLGNPFTNLITGTAKTWIADAIFKWAPNGNGTRQNFKLQGEYLQRKEGGTLASEGIGSGSYASTQSGWYVQGVYQFAPAWRLGVRHDALSSGTPAIGLVTNGSMRAADFSRLTQYDARRNSVMLDFNPSEFSRFRLQYARDQARPEATDQQISLQYIMSLGAHGAHAF